MEKFKSIIYVNYTPYENSGKILDYLLENFDYVFLYSLKFYDIKKKGRGNLLSIYQKGILKEEYLLFQFPVPQSLLFITLPIRSIITMAQIIYYSYLLRLRYGKIDIFFSVNAFTSWVGTILRKINLVSKTVFWVWDYYPSVHESKIIMLARKIYWFFDRWATLSSDKVIFVNQRLINLRRSIGVILKKSNYSVIPLGTDIFNVNVKKKKRVIFGFIGVVKKSMGLGAVFDNAQYIITNFPKASFNIIGSGPDEEYFKEQAKMVSLPTTFHGYLEGETFNDILKKCTIGIALYQPGPGNVSNFGDAGKVKRYLSLGIPVITTDIFEFSKEIEKNKAGIIVRYGNPKDLIGAIKKIMSSYKTYQKNALNLGNRFYYRKIYPEMFRFGNAK